MKWMVIQINWEFSNLTQWQCQCLAWSLSPAWPLVLLKCNLQVKSQTKMGWLDLIKIVMASHITHIWETRGLYFDPKTIFILPLSLNDFFPSQNMSFFNSYLSLFALSVIPPYFAFVLPFYFPFSLFFSCFLPFSFSFLLFSIKFSPFSFPFLFFPPNDNAQYTPIYRLLETS